MATHQHCAPMTIRNQGVDKRTLHHHRNPKIKMAITIANTIFPTVIQ
jgi:hypothetical protein